MDSRAPADFAYTMLAKLVAHPGLLVIVSGAMVMLSMVCFMAPRRRWNRKLDGKGPASNSGPKSQNELLSEILASDTRELQEPECLWDPTTGATAATSSSTSQAAVLAGTAQGGEDYESWLLCPEPSPCSDDDYGAAQEHYTQSYVHVDSPAEGEGGVEDEVQVGEQSGSSPVDLYFRIGSGRGYHAGHCGMVKRFRRLEPEKLRQLSKRQAEVAGLKACRQCRP